MSDGLTYLVISSNHRRKIKSLAVIFKMTYRLTWYGHPIKWPTDKIPEFNYCFMHIRETLDANIIHNHNVYPIFRNLIQIYTNKLHSPRLFPKKKKQKGISHNIELGENVIYSYILLQTF